MDAHFEFACKQVSGILQQRSRDKRRLLDVADSIHKEAERARLNIAAFRDRLEYLDRSLPEKMSKEDAERIVQLHGRDFSLEWEHKITQIEKRAGGAQAFTQQLTHYTASSTKRLAAEILELESAAKEIAMVIDTISKDEKMLRKYVGLLYALRGAFGRKRWVP